MLPYRKILFNMFVLISLLMCQGQAVATQAAPVQQAAASSISGRVTDGSGNGVAGATVLAVLDPLKIYLPNITRSGTPTGTTVSNPNEAGRNYYTVQTDAGGYYNLDSLPSGRYVISARKTGQDFSPLSYIVSTTSGGSSYNFHEEVIPTLYTPGTITLSEATLSALVSISSDGTTYTFASETSDLAQVNVGDVLIGGISALTPEGFLRKVVSTSVNGDQRVVVTEPATLEDAFESLSVSTTQQLTSANVQNLADMPGVTLLSEPSLMGLGDFQFALNNAVLYDNDGNLSTTGDQVVANGSLSVSPDIEFRIRIEDGSLEELYYTSTMSVSTGFTVSSKISLNIPLAETKLIPTIPLGAVPVGPLVLTPELDLIAGVTGSVFTGISTSISNTTSFTAGLWHVDNQTRNLSNFTSNFSFSPPSFQSGLSFKAYIGPKVSVKIYGVVGGYVKPGVALNLTIVPASDPWLTLKGGFEVSVGISVTVPLVRKDLLNFQLGAINHWILLYSLSSSSTTPPNPPSNPSPSDDSTNQSLTAQLSWTGGDPDGDAVVYDVYLNSGAVIPTTKVSIHQSGTTFNPGTLTPGTTYSWRVWSFDQHGVSTSGPVWSFTTGDGNIIPGEMITIPAGSFQMGCDPNHNAGYPCSNAELPLHMVNLSSYLIDKYEVTNSQYSDCVSAEFCDPPASYASFDHPSYYDNPTYANYPVITVSWYDASNYCAWKGKRLPTEAEWEKAARGSNDTRAFPWGDTLPTCDNDLINFYGCGTDTRAVGSYPAGASPYGVLDMAANVGEWVNDWWQADYYSNTPVNNPQGPISGTEKVVRGGSWFGYNYQDILVASRSWGADPNMKAGNYGFRCAASPGN